jgi:hypothetical protein
MAFLSDRLRSSVSVMDFCKALIISFLVFVRYCLALDTCLGL